MKRLGSSSAKLASPVAAKPGRVARFDYEYVRNGTANVFMFVGIIFKDLQKCRGEGKSLLPGRRTIAPSGDFFID
jgi:hypothetical protein